MRLVLLLACFLITAPTHAIGHGIPQCLNLAADGDSITLGFGAANGYPAIIATALGTSQSNQAVDGIGWNKVGNTGGQNMIQHAPSLVDPLLTSLACPSAYHFPYSVIFAGTNDICVSGNTGAQAYAFFQTYLNARLAAGWPPSRILVPTILPRATCTGPATEAQNFNNSLIAGAGPSTYTVVRFDLDANMGCNGCQNNLTYYQSGAIHPTTAGQQILAYLVCLAMQVAVAQCPAY
jgi:hypothetical protein